MSWVSRVPLKVSVEATGGYQRLLKLVEFMAYRVLPARLTKLRLINDSTHKSDKV